MMYAGSIIHGMGLDRSSDENQRFTIAEFGAGLIRSAAASMNRKSIDSIVIAVSNSATTLTSIAE
jgi:hypothetical protein